MKEKKEQQSSDEIVGEVTGDGLFK